MVSSFAGAPAIQPIADVPTKTWGPDPVYPEALILRGGVGIRIMKPLVVLISSPLLVSLGLYGLYMKTYGLAAFFGLPPLLALAMFAPALARAGSFELTTHRLLHKPWFRAQRAYPLGALADLRFDAEKARVRAKESGLDMAFADHFDRLHGALVVWTHLARARVAPPTGEPFRPWLLWQAATSGRPSRRGFGLVLDDMVAFVPETFPPPSTGSLAAGLAVNLLTLPLGVAIVPTHLLPPIGEVLGFFAGAPQSVRRSVVDALVKLMGGWSQGLSSVRCTPAARSDGTVGVTLEAPGERCASVPPGGSLVGWVNSEVGRELARRLPNASYRGV